MEAVYTYTSYAGFVSPGVDLVSNQPVSTSICANIVRKFRYACLRMLWGLPEEFELFPADRGSIFHEMQSRGELWLGFSRLFQGFYNHKSDFPARVKNRLINPAKSNLGKASKTIIDKINASTRAATEARQWRSTQEVTSWFESISDKDKKTFIKFDIVEFYPTITEKTFNKSLDYAKQFTTITPSEEKILKNARESFICHGKELWAKKNGKNFDVTMGAFDGAEIAELVGLLLLKDVQNLLPSAGLYRDDGLATSEKSGPELAKIEKDLHKIFQKHGFKITVEVNIKRTDFLDIVLDLEKDKYGPFRKENDTPMYINKLSNHPPSIIKALPNMISSRLSNISSTEAEFRAEAPLYQKALEEAGYEEELVFQKTKKKTKKQRQRKILWFNPPYNINVSTNLTSVFRNLICKHFPKGTFMGKLFNVNNTKLSYSCMPNINKIISAHNKMILKEETNVESSNCSCLKKNGESCPLQDNCLDKGIVYEASVTTNDGNTKTYVGSTGTTFKARLYNHRSSFLDRAKEHQTALSTYMWKMKDENKKPEITWRTLAKAPPTLHLVENASSVCRKKSNTKTDTKIS